jgi:hypothetical protein
MTYLGGLFVWRCVLRWDMVGIAHGEESVDRAVLVAIHRVDNRMPIENDTEKVLVRQHDNTKRMAKPSLLFKAHRMTAS